jgi:hypothetical protein
MPQMQGVRVPIDILQPQRGNFHRPQSQSAKAQSYGKISPADRLASIKAFQKSAQLRRGKRLWNGTVWPRRRANHHPRQWLIRTSCKMEKPQEAPQSRRQHAQETWFNANSAVVKEVGKVFRLQGVEPGRPPTIAPLKKLPDTAQLDTACSRRQSSHLVQVAIILVEHSRDGGWPCCRLIYAKLPEAFLLLCTDLRGRICTHGET